MRSANLRYRRVNIIAVDDEHFALTKIEAAVKETLPNCALSCFDTPSGAISHAREYSVDVAFLDIEMGGMNGLQLAKRLKDIYSKTNIIFTTGYSHYALDAYSIHACGYLLKPVTSEAVLEAMDYLHHPVKSTRGSIRVRTFGNFEVFIDEKPLRFTRSKTKELFAYLIMRNGSWCSNKEIVSVIWDNAVDSPALQSHYRNLVSDLTRALKSADAEDALRKQSGYLAVAPENFSCDLYDFCAAAPDAVNSYMGEFMSQYSWAEFTNAYLEKMLQ